MVKTTMVSNKTIAGGLLVINDASGLTRSAAHTASKAAVVSPGTSAVVKLEIISYHSSSLICLTSHEALK